MFWCAHIVFSLFMLPPKGLFDCAFFCQEDILGKPYPMKKGEKDQNSEKKEDIAVKILRPDSEWKKLLTPQQYYILREKGTEPPYTGVYTTHFEKGVYVCAGCGQVLFSSDTKYPSHCGWTAFYDVEKQGAVIRRLDRSFGMVRTEILCSRCGGHLGHVFQDGPPPTGLRYCINSAALLFQALPPEAP